MGNAMWLRLFQINNYCRYLDNYLVFGAQIHIIFKRAINIFLLFLIGKVEL